MNKRALFSCMIPILGLPAAVLRWFLYTAAVDDKQLLISGTPLELALWGVTGCAIVLTIACVSGLDGSKDYWVNFPASKLAGIGSWLLAVGILYTFFLDKEAVLASFRTPALVLSLLSAAALVYIGCCRMAGTSPFGGLYTIVTLFFAVRVFLRYKTWSSNPQMMDYVFTLGAILCLMLFSFHLAAFCAGIGKRRMLLGFGLMGSFFCLTASAHGESVVLLITGAIWMLTNLCRLAPPADRKE